MDTPLYTPMDTEGQVIRVLIADDHNVVRGGLIALLEDVQEVLVVGEASDGMEAVEQARRIQPDVILLDLIMPRRSGIEAIPYLKEVSPHSQIIILSSSADDERVLAAIREGAIGHLVKEISTEKLHAGIQLAHQGLALFDSVVARHLIRELNRPTALPPADEPLTEREAEVLILVARGLAVAEVASKLAISERTVHRHLTDIITKIRQGKGPHGPLEPPLPLPIPIR